MSAPLSNKAMTTDDVKRCADLLVDTIRSLASVEVQVFGSSLEVDASIELEGRILSDHNLFRCENCLAWMSTTRLVPEAGDDICYACVKGFNV